MDAKIPDQLRYSSEHEWIDPDTGWMGITNFAQEELGDIVFVELPDTETNVSYMGPFMIVESVKAVSDVYAPADGSVVDVNQEVVDNPELINTSPYDEGRLVQIEFDSLPEELMDAEAYEEHVS